MKTILARNEPDGGCPASRDCGGCVHFDRDYCYYPRSVRTLAQIAEAAPVQGPYYAGEEARFKRDMLKAWEARRDGWKYFCIESPGTADGFPDVAALSDAGEYRLYEFKVSDAKGYVHFQRTQPLFYRKHRELAMTGIAWDVPSQKVVFFDLRKVAALRYKLEA
jgi:hypothetical protein